VFLVPVFFVSVRSLISDRHDPDEQSAAAPASTPQLES
jgi:hypothetical protein